MNIKPNLFLLVAIVSLPSVLLSTVGAAKATSEGFKLEKPSQPFIAQEFRRDTLDRLNKVPVGGRVFSDDGGTGKEASDKGKDACDKCKESCESGNCGEILNPGTIRVLPPDQLERLPGKFQQPQLQGLIKTNNPIF